MANADLLTELRELRVSPRSFADLLAPTPGLASPPDVPRRVKPARPPAHGTRQEWREYTRAEHAYRTARAQ